MLIDGYIIKTALKEAKDRRDLAADQFANSIWTFEGETVPTPAEVVDAYQQADKDFAAIQVVQQWYNLQIEVTVDGTKMRLAMAVKLIGGTGRREKFWRQAIKELRGEHDRWTDTRKLSRAKDEEHAKPQVTYDAAVVGAMAASKAVSNLRTAVGQGNATKLEIPSHLPMTPPWPPEK